MSAIPDQPPADGPTLPAWPEAAAWPAPHDSGAADRLIERFVERGASEAGLAEVPSVRSMLRALGGNSPYLSDLAVRESETLCRLVAVGPQAVVAAALETLRAEPATSRREVIAASLRRAKRSIALATAVADIGGIWPLEAVTAALSDLADTALSLAVRHLLRAAHDAGDLQLPDPDHPEQGGGFTVLGMGKLGARELNYSSDIDLILLYDPTAPIYSGRSAGDAMGSFTARIARYLVSLMELRDGDGYVYRTDLRLRPDPAATPPAVSIPAAVMYYESMGQNWERAAMIKARPVAGDLALGATFLEAIRPFVWRRGLDFAAMADIHAMKRRIDQHKGGALAAAADPVARIAGHNVKLGEGGIREIEFLVQTLQLVWGGRDPHLREPATLPALRLLVEAGRVPADGAAELESAYRYLRQVEHRLQMVADRQTHAVPTQPDEIARVAHFLGFSDSTGFAEKLLGQLGCVRARYRHVFEAVPESPDTAPAASDLDFRGDDPAPEATMAALRALGFAEPERIIAAVRGWQAGRVRALRSTRARDLLTTLLPAILDRLGREPHPDAAFNRFDRFLGAQPTGVQLLSLIQRNPALLDRIAAVLGAAPVLAEHLARHAAALDGLLSPTDEPAAARLDARLRGTSRLEDVLAVTRRVVKEEDFSISVATMEGRLDADESGARRTALADAAMRALLQPVMADFALRYGSVRGGGLAVIALGKAGGREMMSGSDLDLMLIYDHPPEVTESQGARDMPASQWFVRVVHAFVAALTSPGAEGQLYAVDMRLRPSGNKGPVAVSLSGFRRYHAESAWTWERMALTRARVVAGPDDLRERVDAAIAEAMASAGDVDKIRGDAAAMRARLARDLPPDGPWDVKHCLGGQVEVEFIAQALQLSVAARMPHVCSPTTRVALRRLAEAEVLPAADAELLIHADHVWRTVQGILRITVGRDAPEILPAASAQSLLRAAALAGVKAGDLPELRSALNAMAQQVRAVFTRHIGEIVA